MSMWTSPWRCWPTAAIGGWAGTCVALTRRGRSRCIASSSRRGDRLKFSRNGWSSGSTNAATTRSFAKRAWTETALRSPGWGAFLLHLNTLRRNSASEQIEGDFRSARIRVEPQAGHLAERQEAVLAPLVAGQRQDQAGRGAVGQPQDAVGGEV